VAYPSTNPYSELKPSKPFVLFSLLHHPSSPLPQYPYPCLGHYRFLDIQLPRATAYAYITNCLSSGATLLDLGCCIGQELRHLAFSFPHLRPSQLYGLDIKPSFFDVGHALFHDRESFGATFLQADLFDEQEGAGLASLKGKIDIVWTASVIHLWGLERQVLALRVMLALLEGTEEPVLAGRLMGFSEAGEYVFESKGRRRFSIGTTRCHSKDYFGRRPRGLKGGGSRLRRWSGKRH
jgi:SAM-dependent methyltransferase